MGADAPSTLCLAGTEAEKGYTNTPMSESKTNLDMIMISCIIFTYFISLVMVMIMIRGYGDIMLNHIVISDYVMRARRRAACVV